MNQDIKILADFEPEMVDTEKCCKLEKTDREIECLGSTLQVTREINLKKISAILKKF